MASMAICNCCISTSKQEQLLPGRWIPNTATSGASGSSRAVLVRASLFPGGGGGGGAGKMIGKGAPPSPTPTPEFRELYQPFRPPVEADPALEGVSVEEQVQILREKRGLWYQYAIYVPTLLRAGFTPPMIDEATGITGVEQDRIVVASQVRSTLESSGLDPALLAEYDGGSGAAQLYELRILSARQRRAAAEFALARRMSDAKEYRELARAMKGYERRRREEGWSSFTPSPGDCLAFSCYRLSKELKNSAEEREAVLKKGLDYAESDKAREKLLAFIKKGDVALEEGEEEKVGVEVFRLSADAIASSFRSLVLVPVAELSVQDLEAAPAPAPRSVANSSKMQKAASKFAIHHSQSAWKSWISLPAWSSLATSSWPVALPLPDASRLPWKPSGVDEPLLLIVDKKQGLVDAEGASSNSVYAVEAEDGEVSFEKIGRAKESGRRVLGKALLLLRPPREDDLQDGGVLEFD